MAVFGIDISKHQGNIDFDRIVNEGVKFTILRAAYWTSKDIRFEDYYQKAKARGLGVGAYVYSMSESVAEAEREANNLLTILAGKQFEYPIYIDMEDKVQKALPKRTLTDIALTFERILKAHNYVPGIYASKYFYSDFLYDNELRGLEHWIAQWSTKCTYSGTYGMWQFGGETNLIRSKYIAGQVVDQDYAYNDYPSFMKKYGYNGFSAGPGPEPPPEPPTPVPPPEHGNLDGPPAPPSAKPVAPQPPRTSNATFYKNFSKRPNSTKRPTQVGVTVPIILKAGTSIENPTFLIDGIDLEYSYVLWQGHYYFIDDITLSNANIYELRCSQDLLATYKDQIQRGQAFVEYSSSYYNDKILDTRISTTGEVIRASSAKTMENIFDSYGNYTISIIGSSGVRRYQISYLTLLQLGEFISTQKDDGLLTTIQKKYGSLAQCILGCTWAPYELNTAHSTKITIGDYQTDLTGYWNDNQGLIYKEGYFDINIPWINKDVARRKLEVMELYLPMYGSATLNTSKYIGASQIRIQYAFDMFGGVTYTIQNPDLTRDYFTANGGIDVPVAQFTTSPLVTMARGLGGALAESSYSNIAALGDKLANISGASSIIGAIDACGTNASSSGGNGGGTLGYAAARNSGLVLTNFCYAFTSSQESMTNLNGRPLHATANLITLEGYVQTTNANIAIDGLKSDRDSINSMLNSGIFIE